MNTSQPLSRRAFVKASVILGAAAALPLPANANPDYQVGCYTRCFDQYDYKTALDGIAEAGYKYAGIMTAKGKTWVMITPDTPTDEAAQIGREVANRGLQTISVYADFATQAAVSEDAAIKALQRLIANCKACGSPQLLLGGTNDEKIVGNYYKAVGECSAVASEAGVTLSIKPHGGQNSTGPECRKLIEQVNKKNFRLWYDPGNILYYSDGKLDPVSDSATVNGLVCGISIKDFTPPKEVLVTPGTGVVKFSEVMANLQKGGFGSGPVVVECVKRGDLAAVTEEARKARLFVEALLAARPKRAEPQKP